MRFCVSLSLSPCSLYFVSHKMATPRARAPRRSLSAAACCVLALTDAGSAGAARAAERSMGGEERASAGRTSVTRLLARPGGLGVGAARTAEIAGTSLRRGPSGMLLSQDAAIAAGVSATGPGSIDRPESEGGGEGRGGGGSEAGASSEQEEELLNSPTSEDDLKTAFAIFDQDDNGALSLAELQFTMESLNLPLKDEDANALFAAGDPNGYGALSLDDFRRLLNVGATALSM